MPYQVPRNRPQSEFKGGIQILASAHFKYTEEGGTLDAAAIGAAYVPCGSPFIRNMTTGRYYPFVEATHVTAGVVNAGFADPVICDVDFDCNGIDDVVVGQLIYEGAVYLHKLPDSVTAAFRTVTPRIRYIERGL